MNSKHRSSNLKIDSFLQLLFLLLPYTLIFSIFLTELFLIILFIFYISENHNNLYSTIKNNKIIKILIVFYLITLISTIVNFNDYKLFIKNLAYVRFLFYGLSISWLINKFPFLKRLFLYSLFSSYILLFIGSAYEFILKRNCITFTESNVAIFANDIFYCSKKLFIGNILRSDRISSFFGDEMVVGSYVSRLLPLLFYLILDQSKNIKYDKLIIFISLTTTLSIVVLSGERIALFYFILFFVIFIIFTNLKYKITLFSSFIIISFLIIISSDTLKKRLINQTFSQIFLENNQKKITFFSIQHESHAISALKIFNDNALIGIGPKNFRNECKKKKYNISKFSCSTHPHNFYIQLLTETGFLGFLLPFGLLLYLLNFYLISLYYKIINKEKNINLKNLYLYTCFLITLFPVLPTGNIFNNWLSIIFYIPFGFFLSKNKK